jgi:putative transposase
MTGLPRSTFYYPPKISRIDQEIKDVELKDKIEALQARYPNCRGYRTIRAYLKREHGLLVNPKRIRRIMRKYGLICRPRRRFITTTDSDHGFKIYPNLLKGLVVKDKDEVWVGDITYIRILTGFVFLAVILDLYTRKVIGWAISKAINHELTLTALRMAIQKRKPAPGIIHHTDRGVQYACDDYVGELQRNGFRISMSRKGNPYDNAFAESFMKTLKKEEVYLNEYVTFTDVIECVPEFIEEVYNKKRVHSGINYLTPDEFECILKDEEKKNEFGQDPLILWSGVSN